ncbi:hypothetical protein DFQ28_004349 [Apophysomyces sp. BC1034]|nr:hypothetical protein DFQ30_006230 [Apophysomyces sp. BC1015]KAG0178403.1 hypothetical protein DFQ29_003495 [Apophysomyces sp. BC1021]KAG0188791.1 hypothetical protein DFQ28_004349 [Apophysomyces sp. BC1034]
MRCSILLISAAIASLAAADDLQRIPLYRRWNSPGIKKESMIIDDGLLVAKVEVGTPAQTFPVLFNTDTSVTWVPSKKCHSSECKEHATYNSDASSSAVNLHSKKEIKFGDGKCVDVELYKDTVSVAGLQVPNLLLGSAYSVTGIGDEYYLGMLGLGGYTDNGAVNLNMTSKRTSVGSHEISARQFGGGSDGFAGAAFQNGFGNNDQTYGIAANSGSFYQKRWNQPQAEFIFGGIDHSVYKGDIAYMNLPTCDYGNSRYWKTHIKCVKLGKHGDIKIDIKLARKALATLSTGTDFISAPTKQADLLHKVMGAHYDQKSHTYQLKCCEAEKLPDLTFSFDSYQVTLPASTWTKKVAGDKSRKGEEMCYTTIRRNTDEKNWILGGSFLNNFYHIYDYGNKRIGLAELKGDKQKVSIHKIGSRNKNNKKNKKY